MRRTGCDLGIQQCNPCGASTERNEKDMYLKKKVAAAEYSVSVSTIEKLLPKIRRLIGARYPDDAIIYCGNITRIRDDVLRDYMVHSNAIYNGIAGPFMPDERHVWDLKEEKQNDRIC